MNTNKLLSLLREVRLLKFVNPDELQQMANEYPYYQQAHILVAKKYLIDDNPHFEEKLHIAAIYASDRTNLRSVMLYDVHENLKATEALLNEKEVIEKLRMEIPVETADENMVVLEEELTHASMSDTLPTEENVLEDATNEVEVEQNVSNEAEAMEELEVVATDETNIDELIHASMSDMLPMEDTRLEEENDEVEVEENVSNEAEAMEELEVASVPSDASNVDELIHASMTDMLPMEDTRLEEENYEVVAEENVITEAEAMEEIEAIAMQPIKTNGSSHKESFNVEQPHTFSDWLKYIQGMPRSIQHKSSAPDYQPISFPEPPKDVYVEEAVPIEYVPEVMVAEPEDNIEAIDEFVAETVSTTTVAKVIHVKELADRSIEENDEMLTETLAQVYEEQQLYTKAIRVYAKLSLKFPEKSVYFASLIKELKSKI